MASFVLLLHVIARPATMDNVYEDDLFVPLENRPEALTTTVRDLIGRVEKGRVRLPDFQRPLRWSGEDVRKLLDSVVRGYPIGSLLFWKRPAPKARVTVGNAYINAPELPDAWWVVDGQQRTTALAACLLDLDQGVESKWSMFFDVVAKRFVKGPCPPEKQGWWVPVSALGDLRRLGRWNRESFAGTEEQWQTIEDVQQRLLDYSMPAYIVETPEEQALRGIFARMNSTGVRMRADEVFHALLGHGHTSASVPDLTRLQKWCDQNDFGEPTRTDVLKAVLAMSGLDFTRRLDAIPQKDLTKLVSHEDAEAALVRTTDFLSVDCGIPHIRLVPYPIVFVILARWFHIFPSHDAEIVRGLAQWVWRGAVTGSHIRSEVSRMNEQLRMIQPNETAAHTLLRLHQRATSQHIVRWELGAFNSRNARSRLEILALWARSPQYTDGPVSLNALLGADRIAREIWQLNQCSGLEDDIRDLAKTAANRVLLDSPSTGLATTIRDWDPVKHHAALKSHLLDGDIFQTLRDRNISEFLRLRSKAISGYMVEFLSQKAGLQRPDLLPTESYYDRMDDLV